MIIQIARKEFLELSRDGRFRIAGGIVLALLLSAAAFGWQWRQDLVRHHEAAVAQERSIWESQGEKSPHSAAHYGVYAFKPSGGLSFFDPGTDAYTGVTTWLEAHKQNQFLYRPATDGHALQRFGQLTAAAVLQVLFPLLIILLSFSAFAGEREAGTLRLALSQGVSRSRLLAGKALGVAASLAVLLLPAVLVACAMLALTPEADGNLWIRVSLLACGYLLYLACFLLVSFAMSARAQSAQTALVALLGFWFLTCFVVPRAATDLAKRLYPTPSAQEFADALAADQESGIEGVDYNAYLETKTAELLQQYEAKTVEELPFNFAGWRLQTSEEYGNRIFDLHYSELWNRFESQDGLRRNLSVLSPTAAIRSFSMAMAGSDFVHFRHFAEAAEQYRRRLIEFLNADMREHAGEAGFAYLQSEELWSQAAAFAYQQPSAGWAWGRQLVAAAWLFVWFVVAALWAWRDTQTMEVA